MDCFANLTLNDLNNEYKGQYLDYVPMYLLSTYNFGLHSTDQVHCKTNVKDKEGRWQVVVKLFVFIIGKTPSS